MSIVIPSRPARGSREDLGDELRIERARDLVEQQQVRLHGQRPDDRDALLLAARQAIRKVVAFVGEPDPVEELVARVSASARPRPSTLRGARLTLSSTDM